MVTLTSQSLSGLLDEERVYCAVLAPSVDGALVYCSLSSWDEVVIFLLVQFELTESPDAV